MIPMECGTSLLNSGFVERGCLVWTGDGITPWLQTIYEHRPVDCKIPSYSSLLDDPEVDCSASAKINVGPVSLSFKPR